MVRYFALYTIYGAVMTLTTFFQRIYTQNLQITLPDALRALWMCLLESMVFRYVLSFVRLTAFIGYKKKRTQWVEHTGKTA